MATTMLLRVLYWNVWCLPAIATDKKHSAYERAKLIAPYTVGYDVVILNEAWPKWIKDVFRRHYSYSCTTSSKWYKIFDSGLIILSRYPISNVRSHLYSEESNWDWFVTKGVLQCDITIPLAGSTKTMTFATTHMQAYEDSLAQHARKIQTNELINFINTNPHASDFLLIGDINMEHYPNPATNDQIVRTQCYDQILARTGLVDTTSRGPFHFMSSIDLTRMSVIRNMQPQDQQGNYLTDGPYYEVNINV